MQKAQQSSLRTDQAASAMPARYTHPDSWRLVFALQASRDAEVAAEQLEEAQRLTRQAEQQVQELEAAQQEQAKNAAVSAEDADGTGCLHLPFFANVFTS